MGRAGIVKFMLSWMKKKTNETASIRKSRHLEIEERASAQAAVVQEAVVQDTSSRDINARELLLPRLSTTKIRVTSKSGATRLVTAYRTPTQNNRDHVNDLDVMMSTGVTAGGVTIHPALHHISPCPPNKLQLTEGRRLMLCNKMITPETIERCALKMFKDPKHIDHDAFYVSVHLKLCIRFHLFHWRRTCRYVKGDKLYSYLFFSPRYGYFNQVRGFVSHGRVCYSHALMGKSVVALAPCACLEIELGDDQEHLSDMGVKFIRINGDMETVVDLSLDDERLIVNCHKITASM